jgi:drug/metabolite transporter superfamily protein YnfA
MAKKNAGNLILALMLIAWGGVLVVASLMMMGDLESWHFLKSVAAGTLLLVLGVAILLEFEDPDNE